MPDNNILLFDQNKSNIMSDQNYSTNAQRLNGVQQGVASSQLQNKTLYQVSLVAYAIAQLMNANGYNATDADQVSTFVSNMSLSIMQKVLDKATSAEAQAGVATGKWVSPATMKAACLFLSGGTMTGDIAMGSNKITGLAAPVNAGDAVNKQYVDEKVISFSCGDGVNSSITRNANYAWLDTGNVLSIPTNDYYVEVTVLGYGVVSSKNTIAHDLYFNFSNGEHYEARSTNTKEIASTDEYKWQQYKETVFFGESIGGIREFSFGTGSMSAESVYMSTDVHNANITRIRVRASNNGSGLHSMVIRLIKKDS